MSRLKRVMVATLLLMLTIISSLFPLVVKEPRVVEALSPLEAIETYKKEIVASARRTGVWASVTAAQLILECGNPMSDLATVDNNFFGIKWADSHAERYPGAYSVEYSTQEDYGNGYVTIMDNFTHFPNPADGITEHSVIWWNGAYQPELDILYDLNSSMDAFLREMGNGPYATDPSYYSKLRSIIDDNGLEELDKLAYPNGRKFCGFGENTVGEYSYPDDGYNSEDVENIATPEKDEETGEVNLVVKEEDLVGMFPEVFFKSDVKLPDKNSLTMYESDSMVLIKNSILESRSWNLLDGIRVAVVTLGLLLLMYAILIWVCYIFDRVNILFDISLVSLISLGIMHYTDNTDDRGVGSLHSDNIVKKEVLMILVGFFLISGSLFSFIIDVVYFANSVLK